MISLQGEEVDATFKYRYDCASWARSRHHVFMVRMVNSSFCPILLPPRRVLLPALRCTALSNTPLKEHTQTRTRECVRSVLCVFNAKKQLTIVKLCPMSLLLVSQTPPVCHEPRWSYKRKRWRGPALLQHHCHAIEITSTTPTISER